MLISNDGNPIFTTKHQSGVKKNWRYWGPKKGGAHSAGQFGGFYQCGDDRCLIKQDPRISLNIAEFIGGRIYQAIIPEVSAEIKLVRVIEQEKISVDGHNVYVLSEFIPDWKHDLYTEIQHSLHRTPEHSRFKFKETMEITQQLVFSPRELAKFFEAAQEDGVLLNFGQVSATSLLINNMDTNLGNLGVIDKQNGTPKQLGVIDYGGAFRNMTPKINPHSFKKYIATHMLNREGWNNFMFYPESIKITSEFVSQLDKASKIDLTVSVKEAFSELSKFYGIKPIMEFAVRAGLSMSFSEQFFEDLVNRPGLQEKIIQQLADAMIKVLKQRQADLSRFSAQIKMDLCVQFDPIFKQNTLEGSFIGLSGETTFNDVVFSHFDYFKEIILGDEPFKMRKSTHKYQPELVEDFTNKAMLICSSFLLDDNNSNMRDRYKIYTMDECIAALKKGEVNKSDLKLSLNKEFIASAQTRLMEYQEKLSKCRFKSVIKIISDLKIPIAPEGGAYKMLSENTKLQQAILQLDKECLQMAETLYGKEKIALLRYRKDTIDLVLQGRRAFKQGYRAIEAQVLEDIDQDGVVKLVRFFGNLLLIALAAVSVVGLFGMYITREKRGGLLFFSGPDREFSNIAAKLEEIHNDDNRCDAP